MNNKRQRLDKENYTWDINGIINVLYEKPDETLISNLSSDEKVIYLNNKNNTIKYHMNELQKITNILKNKIMVNEKIIQSNCSHDWEFIHEYDQTDAQCKICNEFRLKASYLNLK